MRILYDGTDKKLCHMDHTESTPDSSEYLSGESPQQVNSDIYNNPQCRRSLPDVVISCEERLQRNRRQIIRIGRGLKQLADSMESAGKFLSELTRLFQKARSSGSLYLTMKRYDGRTKPKPRPSKALVTPITQPNEYKCLIRAHLGNKKLTTVVNAKDVNKFQLAYANLLKGNMDGLKKKDKKKILTSTKSKATQ